MGDRINIIVKGADRKIYHHWGGDKSVAELFGFIQAGLLDGIDDPNHATDILIDAYDSTHGKGAKSPDQYIDGLSKRDIREPEGCESPGDAGNIVVDLNARTVSAFGGYLAKPLFRYRDTYIRSYWDRDIDGYLRNYIGPTPVSFDADWGMRIAGQKQDLADFEA